MIKVDVNRKRPCNFRRNQIIQRETHRSEGSFLGKLINYNIVTEDDISLQTMQDINLAMGVDEILTEVLTIKRYMKCQFVSSNLRCRDYRKSDCHRISGQGIGSSLRKRAFRRAVGTWRKLSTQMLLSDKRRMTTKANRPATKILASTLLLTSQPGSTTFLLDAVTSSGDPGCGKSAITASLARFCRCRHPVGPILYQSKQQGDDEPESIFPFNRPPVC